MSAKQLEGHCIPHLLRVYCCLMRTFCRFRKQTEIDRRKSALKMFLGMLASTIKRRQLWSVMPMDPGAWYVLLTKHQSDLLARQAAALASAPSALEQVRGAPSTRHCFSGTQRRFWHGWVALYVSLGASETLRPSLPGRVAEFGTSTMTPVVFSRREPSKRTDRKTSYETSYVRQYTRGPRTATRWPQGTSRRCSTSRC